jgi:hypothetical protein
MLGSAGRLVKSSVPFSCGQRHTSAPTKEGKSSSTMRKTIGRDNLIILGFSLYVLARHVINAGDVPRTNHNRGGQSQSGNQKRHPADRDRVLVLHSSRGNRVHRARGKDHRHTWAEAPGAEQRELRSAKTRVALGMVAVLPIVEAASASQEVRPSDCRSDHTLRNRQKGRADSSRYPRSACGNARHRQTWG